MVLFKAPNVIPGFVDPADTAQAFTEDGWLISGDIGRLDEQGRLHLQGRAKDLIIRGGHNIDPKTIEDALASHPPCACALRRRCAGRLCRRAAGRLRHAGRGGPDHRGRTAGPCRRHGRRRPGAATPRHRAGTDAHDQCGQDLQARPAPPGRRRVGPGAGGAGVARAACPKTALACACWPTRSRRSRCRPCRTRPPPCGHGCARRWRGCPWPCHCLNEHGKTSAHRRATRQGAAPSRPHIPKETPPCP